MSELRIWAVENTELMEGMTYNTYRVCRTYEDRPRVAGMVLMEPLAADTWDLGKALRTLILEARKTGETIAECDMDTLVKHKTGWQASTAKPPVLRLVSSNPQSETPAMAPAQGDENAN